MTKPREVHVTGPSAPYAAGFARSLGDQGYLPGSARNQLLRMAQLSGWLADHQLSPAHLAPDCVAQFLAARRTAGYGTPRSPAAMCQLIEYLRAQGAAPLPAVVLPGTAAETLLARYGLYLERERGLASQSAVDYVRAARVFFVWYSPTAGFDPRGRSSTVIEYVLFVVSARPARGPQAYDVEVAVAAALPVRRGLDRHRARRNGCVGGESLGLAAERGQQFRRGPAVRQLRSSNRRGSAGLRHPHRPGPTRAMRQRSSVDTAERHRLAPRRTSRPAPLPGRGPRPSRSRPCPARRPAPCRCQRPPSTWLEAEGEDATPAKARHQGPGA